VYFKTMKRNITWILTGLLFLGTVWLVYSISGLGSQSDTIQQEQESGKSPPAGSLLPTEDIFSQPAPEVIAPEAEEHDHVVRQWQDRMEPGMNVLGAAYLERGEDRFSLPTFNGEEVVVRITRFEEKSSRAGAVLRGEVVGEPGSLVSLAKVGSAEAGSISIPSQGVVYELRPAPGESGEIVFSEVDTLALGECGVCIESSGSKPIPVPIAP